MPGWARDLGGIMQSSAPSSDEWAYTSYAVDSKILLILLREYNFDIDNVRVVPELFQTSIAMDPLYGALNDFQSYHLFVRKGVQREKDPSKEERRKKAFCSMLERADYKSLGAY